MPSSKSHSMRALLFEALATGPCTIHNLLKSSDTIAMKAALQLMHTDGRLHAPTDVIDCKNSGIALRFLGALCALFPEYSVLTGDASIRTLRPARPLLEGLSQGGCFAKSCLGNDKAPLIIAGPFSGGRIEIDGSDSQPVSALLILATQAQNDTELIVRDPGEKPWIDLTLSWFQRLGLQVVAQDYKRYLIPGRQVVAPFTYTVPADFSSAAFYLAAALITQSEIRLRHLDFSDAQGDKIVFALAERMGARLIYESESVRILPSELVGTEIDCDACIDAVCILSVLACFASTPTRLGNAAIARQKESDRLHAMATELGKMGARIEEGPDFLLIHPATLHGAKVSSHKDHRVAMSLAVAAMAATGPTQVDDVACIGKTFPDFATHFSALGAQLCTSA